MTLRLSTRYALLLITFGTLFHIHAQPLPAVSDCNTAAVADSSTMPRPADYPSALRQRVDSLLRLPLLEHSQLGLCVYDLTADSLLMDCGQSAPRIVPEGHHRCGCHRNPRQRLPAEHHTADEPCRQQSRHTRRFRPPLRCRRHARLCRCHTASWNLHSEGSCHPRLQHKGHATHGVGMVLGRRQSSPFGTPLQRP